MWSPKGTTLRVIRCPTLQVSQFLFPGQRSDTFLTDLVCFRQEEFCFSERLSMKENSEQCGPAVVNQVANLICPDVGTKSHDCSCVVVSVHSFIFGGNDTQYNKCIQCKILTTYIVSLHKQN